MDVHSRFKSSTNREDSIIQSSIEPRFNERFILSLADCQQCLIVDDELNILPISKHAKSITAIEGSAALIEASRMKKKEINSKNEALSFSLTNVPNLPELEDLKESVKAAAVAPLVNLAVTFDQAKVLLQFIDSISEKLLNSTISLTSNRGRGKSATLGLSIAAAIAFSYSHIFITAPSPENVGTVFEFVRKVRDCENTEIEWR